jgi:hypothetical protein
VQRKKYHTPRNTNRHQLWDSSIGVMEYKNHKRRVRVVPATVYKPARRAFRTCEQMFEQLLMYRLLQGQ